MCTGFIQWGGEEHRKNPHSITKVPRLAADTETEAQSKVTPDSGMMRGRSVAKVDTRTCCSLRYRCSTRCSPEDTRLVYLPASACNVTHTETMFPSEGGREEEGVIHSGTRRRVRLGGTCLAAGLCLTYQGIRQPKPQIWCSKDLHPQLYSSIPCTGRLGWELIDSKRHSRAQKPVSWYNSFFPWLLVCSVPQI